MGKKLGFIVFLAALGTIITATASLAATYNFSIGTSNLGGSYYIFGTPWAKIITDKVPNAVATVQSTSGPASNIQLIETGQIKLAYVSNLGAYEGWHGLGWAKGREYRRMRAIFPTYPSFFELVSLADSKMETVRDITGKRLHMSMPGATADIVLQSCIEVLGLKPKDKSYMQTDNAVDMMKDGRLDVVSAVMGIPTAFIMDLQSTHNMRILDIAEEDIDKVIAAYPQLGKGIIPANTYNNQPNDLNTFTFWNFGVADVDLPEDIVYEIVKAVFENRAEFEAAHVSGKYVVPENIVHSVIPLHPGAVRYYREVGIELPEPLTRAEG